VILGEKMFSKEKVITIEHLDVDLLSRQQMLPSKPGPTGGDVFE